MQALELARSHWPASLIVDLMLPHLDGAAVIASRRMEPALSALITAIHLLPDATEGITVVLPKPFRRVDLETLPHRFLEPRINAMRRCSRAGLEAVRRRE